MEPVSVKSGKSTLEFDGQEITMKLKYGAYRSEQVIPIASVSSVQVEDARWGMAGRIEFTLPGGQQAATGSDASGNAFIYSRKQQADVDAFKDAVQAAIRGR